MPELLVEVIQEHVGLTRDLAKAVERLAESQQQFAKAQAQFNETVAEYLKLISSPQMKIIKAKELPDA